jgi:hypothetical protein
MAEVGAAAAFFGAFSAHGMVRGMLLADASAELAHFSAKRAEANRKRRSPSHPLRREEADIRAITTEPDTARHEVLGLLIMGHLHADHVIAAGIADSRAI